LARDAPTAARGATLNRQLAVFNDTFAGTDVTIAWEMPPIPRPGR
jgi:hypothetical protein